MDSNRRLLLHGLTCVSAVVGASLIGQRAAAAPVPSRAVSVAGAVASPAVYAAKDLGQFPAQPMDFKAPDGSVRRYTGALLRDVLTASKPLESDHNALRQSYVLARGTDGYFALFSWAELYITSIGDRAMLVYLRDGMPLADDEGAIALVSPSDSRPGPRYVKWLASVEFRRAIA
ncbi:molybdopterin-dependent oxidoreductase [Paracidovorax cattleyae]|uniref:Oxidoreductase molybdopterin binding domain-containing protein n=1 Tax=Paracidovorax cattleyae TaxID=80868 RepID=A0A1H0WRG6_9BURK|nr:molybdopterin-dependent oxidoreductase [Paracidovorax cattleyae]MBF9263329.1 molybdopterin-dependent oxidoreductase [Paracidovorax cattleyae]SDP93297.1 Oxidoreductase molybdopterin binding domain-containing protein [Paracidovorax cattleyae]